MKLTIGQVSKLFEISTDTLRHYDKIGILKPEINENNGYRYYSLQHLDKLGLILGTKYLGISLSDIKKTIESEDLNEYKNLITLQEKLIKEKIEGLKKLEKTLSLAKEQLDEMINFENEYDFSKLKIIKESNTYYGININYLLEGDFYKKYLKKLEEELESIEDEVNSYIYNILDDGKIVEEDESTVFVKETEKNRDILNEYIQSHELDLKKRTFSGDIVSTKFYGSESELKEYLISLNKYFNSGNDNEAFVMYEFYLPKKHSEEKYFVDISLKI